MASSDLYMNYVVLPQDDTDGTPYHEGYHGDLRHGGGSLCGDISTKGYCPSIIRVWFDQDREEQVQYMHRSVLVNP